MTTNQERNTKIIPMAWKALGIAFALTMLFLVRKAMLETMLILIPAALIAFLLLPLQKLYERRLHPALAALFSLLSLLVPLGLLIYSSIPSITSHAAVCSQKLPALIDSFRRIIDGIAEGVESMGLPSVSISAFANDLLSSFTKNAQGFVNGLFSSIAGGAKYLISPVIAFYMLKDRRKMSDFAMRILPSKNRSAAAKFFMDVSLFLSEYLKKQLVISLITGTLTAVGLAIVGLDAFLFLGLIMAVFNLIPYFGPLLGSIPAAAFALLRGPETVIWSLIVITLVQQIESVVVTPRVLSGASGFHPAIVILLILFGGSLFGLWGMLFAVPVATILRSAYISFTNAKIYRKNV